jgi:hypothetical protein
MKKMCAGSLVGETAGGALTTARFPWDDDVTTFTVAVAVRGGNSGGALGRRSRDSVQNSPYRYAMFAMMVCGKGGIPE